MQLPTPWAQYHPCLRVINVVGLPRPSIWSNDSNFWDNIDFKMGEEVEGSKYGKELVNLQFPIQGDGLIQILKFSH